MKELKVKETNKTIQELITEIKNSKTRFDELIEVGYYFSRCEFCGKFLTRYAPNVTHVNITQNPQTHYFCSYECKLNWVFLFQKIVNSEEIPIEIIEVKP